MGRRWVRLAVTAKRLRDGQVDAVRSDLAGWTWSERISVGMRRDFESDDERPGLNRVPLEAVPLDDRLAAVTFDPTGLGDRDRHYLERRRAIWDAEIRGAWVAIDPDGRPAYLQWLIPSDQAERVAEYWGPLFPELAPDTLLVEGAWIPPAFRGQKVMGDGLFLVSEAARAAAGPAVRYALCYPEADNRGVVLGSRSAGYRVVERRVESWRLGRRSVRFEPAGEEAFPVFEPRKVAGRS
ncbi:MAG: hypothetical protein AAF547_22990 [Actinomycetota bacterium]